MAPHELAYTKGLALVDYGREVEQEIALLQTQIETVPAPRRTLCVALAGDQAC